MNKKGNRRATAEERVAAKFMSHPIGYDGPKFLSIVTYKICFTGRDHHSTSIVYNYDARAVYTINLELVPDPAKTMALATEWYNTKDTTPFHIYLGINSCPYVRQIHDWALLQSVQGPAFKYSLEPTKTLHRARHQQNARVKRIKP